MRSSGSACSGTAYGVSRATARRRRSLTACINASAGRRLDGRNCTWDRTRRRPSAQKLGYATARQCRNRATAHRSPCCACTNYSYGRHGPWPTMVRWSPVNDSLKLRELACPCRASSAAGRQVEDISVDEIHVTRSEVGEKRVDLADRPRDVFPFGPIQCLNPLAGMDMAQRKPASVLAGRGGKRAE